MGKCGQAQRHLGSVKIAISLARESVVVSAVHVITYNEQVVLTIGELEYFGKCYNFETYNPSDVAAIDTCTVWYNWFANSAMTSHIANECIAFVECEPLHHTSVIGVGGTRVPISGQGMVELESHIGDKVNLLQLRGILHILTNKNNLLSLG